MNVRTITSFILAVVLMASAGGVYAAEQAGQGSPYTGPDTPVMTTAWTLKSPVSGATAKESTMTHINQQLSQRRYDAFANGDIATVPEIWDW
jgi:hypothetical protein